MKHFIYLLLVCSSAWSATSVVLPPGKTGTVAMPGFTASEPVRIEGHIHNRTVAAPLGQNAFAVAFQSFQTGFGISFYLAAHDRVTGYVQNAGSTTTGAPPSNFQFRIQKVISGTTATRTFEVWDMTQPGAPLVYNTSLAMGTSTSIPASTLQVGHTYADFQFAFLKIFNTTVATGGAAPGASSAIGNIVNYPFEGTAAELDTDTSGNGRHLTWSGGTDPNPATTPAVAPICDPGDTTVANRAGALLTVDGSGSFSSNDAPLTYRWQIIEQPREPKVESIQTVVSARGGRPHYYDGRLYYDKYLSEAGAECDTNAVTDGPCYRLYQSDLDGSNEFCINCDDITQKHTGTPVWDPLGRGIFYVKQRSDSTLTIGTPGQGYDNEIFFCQGYNTSTHTCAARLQIVAIPAAGGQHGILHPQVSSDGGWLLWGQKGTGGCTPPGCEFGKFDVKIAPISWAGTTPTLGTITTFTPSGPWHETHQWVPCSPGGAPDRCVLLSIGGEGSKPATQADVAIFRVRSEAGTVLANCTGAAACGSRLVSLTGNTGDWDEHIKMSPSGDKYIWARGPVAGGGAYPASDWWQMNLDGSEKVRLTFYNASTDPPVGQVRILSKLAFIDNSRFVGLAQKSSDYTDEIVVVNLTTASQARFVNNNVSSATVELEDIVFGQYTLGLTVSDGTLSSSCTVTHGVVPYDTDGTVKYPPGVSDAVRILIGPLTAVGQNPLAYADEVGILSANEFDAIWGTATNIDRRGYWDDDPQNWNPGTVSVTECTKNGQTCVETGATMTVTCDVPGTCQFQTHVCNGSTSPRWGVNDSIIFIRVPVYEGGVPIVPAETAWTQHPVQSCPDDNTLTLRPSGQGTAGFGIGAPAGTAFSGLVWSDQIDPAKTSGTTPTITTAYQAWSHAAPSAVDFYDTALGFYSFCYATGLTKYCDRARYIADRQYSNPINLNKGLAGYRVPAPSPACVSCGQWQEPRDINLTGVILRALDGKPEYWTGIRRVCNYLNESYIDASPPRSIGNREAHYSLAFLAACALADPDNTIRAAWVAAINAQMTHFLNERCGGSAGNDCHGRNLGQWVRDGYGSCGSLGGFYGGNPPGTACNTGARVVDDDMRANVTNASNTVTFTGGTLTYPSNHPLYPNQPVTFGPDNLDADANTCTGVGTGTAWTCAEGTRTYTDGMMVSLIVPSTQTGATTLNYDGTVRNIRAANGTSVQALYAGYKNTLWASGGIWRVLWPVNDGTGTGNVRLAIQVRCDLESQATGWYWPQRVNSTTIKLRPFSTSLNRTAVGFANWPYDTATGCMFHIDQNAYMGGNTSPFMHAIVLRALAWSRAATVQAGAPNATSLTLLSDAAKWWIDYGYDPLTGGLYYIRTSATCEQVQGGLLLYGEMNLTIPVQPGCNYDVGSSSTARGLTPEGFGGIPYAYMLETDPTRKAALKAAATKMYAKSYGATGYPCTGDYAAYCDGGHQDTTEQTYTVGLFNYRVDKYFGFAWGYGGSLSTPAGLAQTGSWPPTPTTRDVEVGFRLADVTGATGVRITLKDQHGTTLTPVDCATSPCSVTVPDNAIGNYQFRIAYRITALNRTLVTGGWQTLVNE